jgi:hypothetical protein
LAREQFAPSTAYKTAGQLQAIVDLMREMTFIRLSVVWQSPLIRPRSNESRITPEAIAAREEMMPSSAALHAIGAIFNIAEGFTDVVISSMLALMLCAPERVNEVVRLEHTCLLDPEAGEFEGHTGIRWPGSKGAKDTIKWIPAAMSEVAKSAIFRIQASTQGARDIAKWYEDNPTKIYLHKDAEYLRGKAILNYAEVALILWGTKGRVESVGNWCKSPESLRPNRPGEVLFSEVERKVLGMLPTTFPYTSSSHRLKFSNALFVMRKDELHEKRSPYECMFDLLEQGDIANRLGQRDSSGIESIFTKYGFTEDDGTPIYVTSHQFRHYLNTLAQLGGLSQTEIAVFSGRKDVNQNTTYDHLSSTEVQQPISTAIQVHGFMSHLVEMPTRSLIHRQEFLGLGVVAAHTTEYGYCVHNFASEPCQMHMDCINCTEQVCVKGDAHREANLRQLQVETEGLLREAQSAMSDEEFGADKWVIHQEQTLGRVKQLLLILESSTVPVGAQVRLKGLVPVFLPTVLRKQVDLVKMRIELQGVEK